MTRYITEMQLDIHNLHNIILFLVSIPLRVEIPHHIYLPSSTNLHFALMSYSGRGTVL